MRDPEAFRFGSFRLRPHGRELLLNGTPVHLGSRALDLLIALVTRRGLIATKDELMAEVWPGTVVEENNLATQISTLRKVLVRDPDSVRSLLTVPGRGYRFVARVEVVAGLAADTEAAPSDANSSLSLVVLPFSNLSSDVEQAYFAEGMSETVTTDLSRISGLLVISSATAAALKERVDVRQLCRELGVQYAVKGSVQRDGQNVRINAQLVDCRSAVQIWSERFDGDSSDLFALQDRITGRIANSIGREIIVAAERDREMCNTDPNSSDLLMKGIVADNKPQCLESLQEQEHLFGQALHLDPKNNDALARLARAILLQSIQLHVPVQMKQEKLSQGADAAEKAVHANPNHARAHLAMGLLHMLRGEFALAILANETAISLDRNLTQAHSNLGNSLVHLGRAREAIRPLEVAIRLDPSGPQVGAFQSAMGLAQLQLGRTQSAVEWFSRARASNPRLARAHAGLAMALAVDGDALGARVAVGDLLRLAHDYRLSQTIDAPFPASPARYRQFYEEVLIPAAKKAGVPA